MQILASVFSWAWFLVEANQTVFVRSNVVVANFVKNAPFVEF
jgi:hypothetical protein